MTALLCACSSAFFRLRDGACFALHLTCAHRALRQSPMPASLPFPLCPPSAAAAPSMPVWKCQSAIALTQASFVLGSVFLKSSLKYVDEEAGETFSPVVYALAREAFAGPILLVLSWIMAGGWGLPQSHSHAVILVRGRLLCGGVRLLGASFWVLPSLPPAIHSCSRYRRYPCWLTQACCSLRQGPLFHADDRPLLAAGKTAPKRGDLWRVGLMGGAMFLSQLLYILGIELSGVTVATCMQPAIPVRVKEQGQDCRVQQLAGRPGLGGLLAQPLGMLGLRWRLELERGWQHIIMP